MDSKAKSALASLHSSSSCTQQQKFSSTLEQVEQYNPYTFGCGERDIKQIILDVVFVIALNFSSTAY